MQSRIQTKRFLKYTAFSQLPIVGDDFTVYFVNDGSTKKIYYWAGSTYQESVFISDFLYDYYPTYSSLNTTVYQNRTRDIIIIEDETSLNTTVRYFFDGYSLNKNTTITPIDYITSQMYSLNT